MPIHHSTQHYPILTLFIARPSHKCSDFYTLEKSIVSLYSFKHCCGSITLKSLALFLTYTIGIAMPSVFTLLSYEIFIYCLLIKKEGEIAQKNLGLELNPDMKTATF